MAIRRLNKLIRLTLAIACLALPAIAQKGPVLVISNNGEDQMLLADARTFEILASLPAGSNPHDIAASRDGRSAYVTIMGRAEKPGNSIGVIDVVGRRLKGNIDLGKYAGCHDVRVSRDGKLLWTTCATSKSVLEIDTVTGKIKRDWKLDRDGAWMLVVTPDERKIYTANLEGKGVSIIDRRSNSVRSIDLGTSQIGIDVSPNGKEIWAHQMERSRVAIIDTSTDRITASVPSGGKGFGRVKFTPDGKYVLVPQGESLNLAVFDASDRHLVRNIQLSAEPKVITVSSDSKQAFISSPPGNKVLVIDLVGWSETRAVPLGKNTDGIVFVP